MTNHLYFLRYIMTRMFGIASIFSSRFRRFAMQVAEYISTNVT